MSAGTPESEGEAERRYCEFCGEIFAAPVQACPDCRLAWKATEPVTVRETARFLTLIEQRRRATVLPEDPYGMLRSIGERQLRQVRPPRRQRQQAATAATAAPAAVAPVAGSAVSAPIAPRKPPAPPFDFGAWAARRQADILLYLGAFLLSISAIIFVAYQGEALTGPVRLTILAAYTVGFLGLGLALHRWERVREAGPVFVALGAILVPVDFVALRTQVLSEGEVANDVLWLFGAGTSAILYFVLVARGYGRYYAVPAVPAALIAWGALGSVVELPDEWFGAWYESVAAGLYVAGAALHKGWAKWLRRGGLALGVPAILYAHVAAPVEDTDSAQLAVTYLLATLGAGAAIAIERTVARVVVFWPLAALTALTASWSAFDLAPEWWGIFATVAGFGYLLTAHLDAESRTRGWAGAAGIAGLVAILSAHWGQADAGASREGLVATYGVVLGGSALASWRWGWRLREAAGLLPALAAGTAITSSWAFLDFGPEWYGTIAAAASAGYLLLAVLDREKAVAAWLPLAAMSWTGGILEAHAYMADVAPTMREALPAAYGVSLTSCAIACARWRFDWRMGPAFLPALAAGFGAAFAWSEFEMRPAWLPAWTAGAAAGYLAIGEADRALRQSWRGAAATVGGLALAGGHLIAANDLGSRWQLPVAYSILVAASAWDTVRRRDAAALLLPVLAGVAGATILWAAGAGREWWCFPALGVAAAVLAAERSWPQQDLVRQVGWTYVALLIMAPTVAELSIHYDRPEFGVAAQGMSAAMLWVVAWRSRGAILRVWSTRQGAAIERAERLLLINIGVVFLFAATGSANAVAELEGAERGWPFAAIGGALWLAISVFGRGRPEISVGSGPAATAAFAIASMVAHSSPGMSAVVFAGAAAGPALAAVTNRRLTLVSIAQANAMLAMWATWRVTEWEITTLPLAYAAVGGAGLVILTRWRKYALTAGQGQELVTVLSWSPWVVAAVVSAGQLNAKADEFQLRPGEALETTREWAMFTSVLASTGAAVTAEGWRLRTRLVWVMGTAALLVAGLMAIATTEPTNVQWYTIPTGLYLAGLSMTWRRTSPFFGRHMELHEALAVCGILFLVLPPAEQSFEPGGAKYGFELIAMSLVFLAVGLTLHQRWLVPGGVLTLSGVAVRWVTGGFVDVPYWLLLGLLGTALLATGMTVLLQKERWDRLKAQLARWWLEAPSGGAGTPAGQMR